jgi:hypothetical protein
MFVRKIVHAYMAHMCIRVDAPSKTIVPALASEGRHLCADDGLGRRAAQPFELTAPHPFVSRPPFPTRDMHAVICGKLWR